MHIFTEEIVVIEHVCNLYKFLFPSTHYRASESWIPHAFSDGYIINVKIELLALCTE